MKTTKGNIKSGASGCNAQALETGGEMKGAYSRHDCVEGATGEENPVILCRSVQISRPHIFVSMRGEISPTIAMDTADIFHIPSISTTTRVQEVTFNSVTQVTCA